MSRLACLAVPLFPLAARLRSEPELAGEPVAVFDGNGDAARAVAATRPARQAGIRRGMTLPQARILLPDLIARGRDTCCEASAQETLLEAAEAFSPRVEDAGGGLAYLDLTGLERRFAGRDAGPRRGGRGEPCPQAPAWEVDLARELMRAAGRAGLPARVGIASSKLAARVAAGLPHPPTVVPEGSEAAFLAPLPLERLEPEAEVAAALRRWGIRSIGDLARLPGTEVASRLGRAGQELHQQARGHDPRPLIPRQPPPAFREGMELEWPLVSLEPFLFVARTALERLCRRLEARGLGCARLGVSLELDPEGSHQRSLRLPAPTQDPRTLLTLVRLDLEDRPPGAPVAAFRFTASPDRTREAQLSLHGPAVLSPDRLATTLARLSALLGPGRMGSPRAADGHRPERFGLRDYVPPPPPDARGESRRGRGLLSVRVLRPPVPLVVVVASHRPLRIRSLTGEGSRIRVQGQVKIASGPWRMEEGWWSEEPADREYWDVELADGTLCRIFRDRRQGGWFADGVYD